MSTKITILLACLLASLPAFAYDTEVSGVKVGMIRVYGNSPGLSAFTREDGQNFPGCTSQPTHMWRDSSYVTSEGSEALLSVVLTAKATDSTVRIYYSTTDGNCRFQIIDLE